MKKLIFGLIATLLLAFNGNAQNLRANFLKGKTYDEAIAAFNKLSDSDKSALWVEKLDQLLTQKLPEEQIIVIKKIKETLTSDYKSETSFIDSAINLAKITPFEDFTQMIESLYDYQYNGKFYGSTVVPDSILNDIKNLGSSENLSKTSGSSYCNCRWTCIWHNDYNPSGGCSHTPDGCGFLWLQSCTGHYN